MLQSTLLAAGSNLPASVAAVESAAVPEHAPFVALAFLGMGAALLIAAGAAALCLALRRRRAAAVVAGAAAAGLVLYAGLLVALSLSSRDRVLSARGRKYFCEIDCHVAYSLVSAERTRTVGAGKDAVVSAAGTFVVARVRTWFDPTTIGPMRGNASLTPNPRTAWLVDRQGRRYEVAAAATKAYELARPPGSLSPFSKPLVPGESYESAVVFGGPATAAGLRLFVGDPPGVENALLGHENSPLHGKVYFALE